MKTMLFIFLFLAGSIVPNLIFAQYLQQGSKLVGTGSVGSVLQGTSVAISSDGNTMIVGGPSDNLGIGAVWIFTRSGGVWTQQGPKLVGTGAVGISRQGISVDVSSDGNTAIVGGNRDNNFAGAVWVFTRSSDIWTQQGSKLIGTGATGNSQQGWSVDVTSNGNSVIVGGVVDDNEAGAVWVFTRSGGVWAQQGLKLVGTGAIGNALQGRSVAISSDGSTFIEGGLTDNANAGAVWVFVNPFTDVKDEGKIVNNFSLQQNYPNPFNPSTKIRWQSPVGSHQKIKVYDVLGNEVATLVNEEKPAGIYEVEFNVGRDSSPALASGIYFYKLQAGNFLETKKMLLIK